MRDPGPPEGNHRRSITMNPQGIRRVLALFTVGLCVTAALAQSADQARFMPADTAIYLGWSMEVDPDDPCQVAACDMIDALASSDMLAEASRETGIDMSAVIKVVTDLGQVPGSLGLIDVVLDGPAPDIQAVLLLRAGDRTSEVVNLLDSLAEKLGGEAYRASPTRSVGSVEFHACRIGPKRHVRAFWRAEQGPGAGDPGRDMAAAQGALVTLRGARAQSGRQRKSCSLSREEGRRRFRMAATPASTSTTSASCSAGWRSAEQMNGRAAAAGPRGPAMSWACRTCAASTCPRAARAARCRDWACSPTSPARARAC
jgi:hypothetical protein